MSLKTNDTSLRLLRCLQNGYARSETRCSTMRQFLRTFSGGEGCNALACVRGISPRPLPNGITIATPQQTRRPFQQFAISGFQPGSKQKVQRTRNNDRNHGSTPPAVRHTAHALRNQQQRRPPKKQYLSHAGAGSGHAQYLSCQLRHTMVCRGTFTTPPYYQARSQYLMVASTILPLTRAIVSALTSASSSELPTIFCSVEGGQGGTQNRRCVQQADTAFV